MTAPGPPEAARVLLGCYSGVSGPVFMYIQGGCAEFGAERPAGLAVVGVLKAPSCRRGRGAELAAGVVPRRCCAVSQSRMRIPSHPSPL